MKYPAFLLVLALVTLAPGANGQTCEGTCLSPADRDTVVEILKEKKCLQTEKPQYTLDPINIVTDRDGRIFFSGDAPHPYKLHMTWCNYTVEAEGKINVVAAVQEPPTSGFRFRPKAYMGMLLIEPFRAGDARQGIDAGLMVDPLYFKDFNLNFHVGFRSFGGGLGVDITRTFGAYLGWALTWDGLHSNPETSLWFSFL